MTGSVNWLNQALLQFFGWVSWLIYGMVSIVTQGFFNLSYIQIFNSTKINEITDRIYIVLAVFMIFKLAFTLIQYLVSPDQVNDKQAGMGKLLSRTMTSFIMLIGIPILFEEFIFGPTNGNTHEPVAPEKTYQAIIARTIPKIILGSGEGDNSAEDARSMGEQMAVAAFSAFVQPREGESDEDSCPAPSLESATLSDIADATYARCSDVVDGGKSNIFAYDYNWLFSIIVGAIMLFIMLFFTVDIAIRAIKLSILRILAPIPIISYVDPKSAKDGAFNNWLKSLVSTFLELFIKVAVIYIIIYVIRELTASNSVIFDNISGLDTGEQLYAKVFIIIGLLLFAVQASGFIKNIFGIKDQGSSAGLGALLGGAGALLTSGGLAGAAMAMASGATAGAQGKGAGQFGKGRELGKKMSGQPSFAERQAERNRARYARKAGVGEDAIAAAEDRAQALQEQAQEAEIQAKADPTNVEKQRLAAQTAAAAQKANDTVNKMKEYAKDPRKAAAQGKIYTRSQYARKAMASGAAAVAANVADRIPYHPSSAGNRFFSKIDQQRDTMGAKLSGAEAMAANANKAYQDGESAKAYQAYLNQEADIINDMNADEAYNNVHSQTSASPTSNSSPSPAPGPTHDGSLEGRSEFMNQTGQYTDGFNQQSEPDNDNFYEDLFDSQRNNHDDFNGGAV